MLLALASGNTFSSPGKTTIGELDVVMAVSPELVAVTKQAFYDLGERPIWLDRGYNSGLCSIGLIMHLFEYQL